MPDTLPPWQDGLAHALGHDLGAQLRHVLGFTNLLQQELAGEIFNEQSGWLAKIDLAGETAQAMLGALVQAIRATNVTRRPMTLADLTQDYPALACDVSETCDAPFQADVVLLRGALSALVANADQFASGVRGIHMRRDHDFVAMTVETQAQNFSNADFRRARSPFVRLTSRPTADNPGVGLTFANTVARAHGGDLEWLTPGSIRSRFPSEQAQTE